MEESVLILSADVRWGTHDRLGRLATGWGETLPGSFEGRKKKDAEFT